MTRVRQTFWNQEIATEAGTCECEFFDDQPRRLVLHTESAFRKWISDIPLVWEILRFSSGADTFEVCCRHSEE
jgi:hypothetical protein